MSVVPLAEMSRGARAAQRLAREEDRALHFVSNTFKANSQHFDLHVQPDSEDEEGYDPAWEPWSWPLRMALVMDDVVKLDALLSLYPRMLERESPEDPHILQQAARFGADNVLVRLCGEHGVACDMQRLVHPHTGSVLHFCRGCPIFEHPPVGRFCHSFQCYEGDTPLMQAALTGQVRTVRCLLDLGADLDCMNKWGDTALASLFQNHVAEYNIPGYGLGGAPLSPPRGALTTNDCQLATICLLLSRGASLDVSPHYHGFPNVVDMARECGNPALADYMLSSRRAEYPGMSARLDVTTRQSLAVAWALVRRNAPPRGLGHLPLELVHAIANELPPLPEPTRDEVNELLSSVILREHRGRVSPLPCIELLHQIEAARA